MKFSTIAFFVLGMVLGAGGVYLVLGRGDSGQKSAVPLVAPAKQVRTAFALGRIQPAGGILTLGVPLPDRLGKLLVDEGQDVKEGEALAELDSLTDRKMELALLESQIKEAEAKIEEIHRSGAQQLALDKLQEKQIDELEPIDVKMQELKVDFLKKQAAQARESLARLGNLASVSRQEREQQELTVLQSQAELAGAEELLNKLKVGNQLNRKLAHAKAELTKATVERTLKEVPLATLKQQRDMAERRLKQTTLKAPSKGKILKIFTREGELVGAPQPILQLADLSKMAVIAEVYETDIHRVSVGQRVEIASKVEGVKLTGKVVFVANMIAKNRVYDADPLADVDRRVIEVKILLDQPKQAEALINHQVNVDFQPR